MNHKRSEMGYAHLLFLIFISLIFVIGGVGWFVYRHNNSQPDIASATYVPQEISVTFKDSVTYQQASQLVSSYGFQVEHPESAESDFIPKSFRGIKTDKYLDVMDKLRAYPEVESVTDDSADPVNNRAAKDEKWIEVIWQQNVTFARIKQIQTATGYGVSTQPQGITRTVYTNVPTGKENFYVQKFNQEDIVKQASRTGVPVLLNG